MKIRGFRIELAEIEAVLCDHPSVDQAVAIVLEPGSARARIAAIVRPSGGRAALLHAATLADDLRTLLLASLPAYMVPSTIEPVERLPTTPNGKLDREAAGRLCTRSTGGGGAPRTPLERSIIQLWRELLPCDEIGPRDSFFELGGHSLLLVESRERLQVEI
ncbi:MAG: non-ribosomal peptide synthetase, partial [bacterium]|nr:non-ribosomal peptide synthetase [bacterium]